jgi:hypothetical protein
VRCRRDGPRAPALHFLDFAQGLALCEAYDAYRTLVPSARISFEHMVYLHSALSRGDELALASCRGCGALLVTERIALVEANCVHCASVDPECKFGAAE